jgi:hypothetical protein
MLVTHTTLLCFCFAGSRLQLLETAVSVVGSLTEGSSSSSSAVLKASGYDMATLLSRLLRYACAAAACYPDLVKAAEPGGVAAAVVGNIARLISALEAVGRACSVFAVPHCCNNPGCSNMSGATEAAMVAGKGCICSGCKVARYCGKGCQKAHWKQHKPVCKMLGAAGQHS